MQAGRSGYDRYDPKTGRSLYLLRPSRGRDVIREVLGDCWKGTITCDGRSAYRSYRVQRCWAHLIRGLRDIADKNPDNADVYNALKRLRDIYHDAKRDVAASERAALHKKATRRIKLLISRYEDDSMMGGYMKKLERALPNAFWFVLDPEIPPTNNPAETLLREIVVHRKIRGGIRSAKTILWMGYLFTCITTWKNQGLDCRKQLLQYV